MTQLLLDFIDPPIIHVTTDYKIFKIISYNRKVMHMTKFSKSLALCNKLYVHPIVVNKSMEVIDGQHRLAYAQECQLPIYYVIDPNFHPSDLIYHNITATNWIAADYGKFYSTCDSEEITPQQRRDYAFAVKLCREYNLAYDIFLKLFHTAKGQVGFSVDFRNGNLRLKMSHSEIIETMIPIDSVITYLKQHNIIKKPNMEIYKAIYGITRGRGYDPERMFKKMEEDLDNVAIAFKFRKHEEIGMRLLDVYNKHAKTKLELSKDRFR